MSYFWHNVEKCAKINVKGDYLENYRIVEKRISMEILREKVKANTEKIKRFKEWDEQYRHNKLFEENQKKCYMERENSKVNLPAHNPEEATEFWKGI